ncbi:MAG: hypothetical protein ACI8RZ_005195 [Myxococcota bacterium]|jgi:hypothetical protein
MIIIPFSGRDTPRHEALAAAYLAAVEVALGAPLDASPTIRRINEDYGSRQEEHYDYGGAKVGLTAHAVGLMSGHGRHGTRTAWQGRGIAITGVSQRHALGRSDARIDLSELPEELQAAAGEAFCAALSAWDVRAVDDGAAIAAVNDAVGRWQTGTAWPRDGLAADLRRAVAGSMPHSPPGAAVRFLLARLLLIDRHLEEAEGLLEGLSEAGASLAFCRGLACGLAADGSLWYVYRPHTTAPPWPHMEVLLALGWCAELREQPAEATARYRAVLALDGSDLRGGIRPDRSAEAQLERLG